ncbi:DUF2332 family protein [Branchiibius cervicis]|uniref:DUF2332 family protein n=1 Tax=Branchiibius cervicis TaxID=908252 RepID=A0ABW2ANM8_9MICO
MTGWYDASATLRAFAAAAPDYPTSALYGALCRAIAQGSYAEREAFESLAARGWPVVSPADVDSLFRAVHYTLLQRRGRDELAHYYASAGGRLGPDARAQQLFVEFVRDHRTLLLDTRLLPREANDPEPGWRMLNVLAAYAERAPMQLDLLNVHARAGVEVVTDLVGQPAGGSLLAPHRVVRRRCFDPAPQRLADPRLRDWLIAHCPPDDAQRWDRIHEAIERALSLEVVVGQGDAVAVAQRAQALGDAVPVVLGSDLQVQLPVLEATIRARAGRTIWLVDDHAPYLARVSSDPKVGRLDGQARVTLLREYLDGQVVGSLWGADWIVGGWMALRGSEEGVA